MVYEYIAHGKQESKIIQSVFDHNTNVAFLAEKNCSLEKLKNIAWLAGILHDAGKYHFELRKEKNVTGN